MPWTQIALDAPDELKDALLGALAEFEIGGVWESGEPRPGETRLSVYFEQPDRVEPVERAIHDFFTRLGLEPPPIARLAVDERDWSEEWKKTYTSFPIGDNFFVVPSWRSDECPNGRIEIHLDPGQAFGSGVHETTQMTMEAMEQLAGWIDARTIVFDLGTGSGILAIAARLLGARTVIACDFDPIAVTVARANALRNAQPEIGLFCGSVDGVAAESIDLMLANLTSDTITQVFADIDRALKPSGFVVFSGVLAHQGEDIRALAKRFRYFTHEEIARGEWLALVFEKHGH
jgi:ribosomal protein L11 methyltransferase